MAGYQPALPILLLGKIVFVGVARQGVGLTRLSSMTIDSPWILANTPRIFSSMVSLSHTGKAPFLIA